MLATAQQLRPFPFLAGVDQVIVVSPPARSAACYPGRTRRVRVAKLPRCEEIVWSPTILEPRSHFSANLVEWSTVAVCESTAQKGSVQMIRVVIDTVLFSCMGAIVTGIVIAAATLLG